MLQRNHEMAVAEGVAEFAEPAIARDERGQRRIGAFDDADQAEIADLARPRGDVVEQRGDRGGQLVAGVAAQELVQLVERTTRGDGGQQRALAEGPHALGGALGVGVEQEPVSRRDLTGDHDVEVRQDIEGATRAGGLDGLVAARAPEHISAQGVEPYGVEPVIAEVIEVVSAPVVAEVVSGIDGIGVGHIDQAQRLGELEPRPLEVADELADDLVDEVLGLHVVEVDPALGEQHRDEHPATTRAGLQALAHAVQLGGLARAPVAGEQARDRSRAAGDRVGQADLDVVRDVELLLPVDVQVGLPSLQRAQGIELGGQGDQRVHGADRTPPQTQRGSGRVYGHWVCATRIGGVTSAARSPPCSARRQRPASAARWRATAGDSTSCLACPPCWWSCGCCHDRRWPGRASGRA